MEPSVCFYVIYLSPHTFLVYKAGICWLYIFVMWDYSLNMSRDILYSCIIFPYNFNFFDYIKLISWSWWFGVLVNVGSCGRLENLGLVLEICIRWLLVLIWLIAFLAEKLRICLLKEKGQEILVFFCCYLIVSSHKSILS